MFNEDKLKERGLLFIDRENLERLKVAIDTLADADADVEIKFEKLKRLIKAIKNLGRKEIQFLLQKFPTNPTPLDAWNRTKALFPKNERGELYERTENELKGVTQRFFDNVDEKFAMIEREPQRTDEYLLTIHEIIGAYLHVLQEDNLNQFRKGEIKALEYSQFRSSLNELNDMLPLEPSEESAPPLGGGIKTTRRQHKRRNTRRGRRPRRGWTRRRQ